MNLLQRLGEIRAFAEEKRVPIRQHNRDVYAVLASCMKFCGEVQSEGLEQELRQALTHETHVRNGKGSRRLKPHSDVYNMVCRYVFGHRSDRSSLGKYAQVIREAANRQISPDSLEQWLVDNGGARALYLRVQTKNKEHITQTLHLKRGIKYPKEGEFCLTLRYDGAGFFDVVKEPLALPPANT